MTSFRLLEVHKIVLFNPSEKIEKGKLSKKIAMEQLSPYRRKISGYEFANYTGGPKFRNGDTLLAKITPCLENGKTAFVDILDVDEVAFGSSEFIVLRNNEESDSKYVFYLARSPSFRKKAISCMEGTSGRKRVNEKALKLQVLPVPDKKTQKNIAKVLSCLDSKIELNNKINAELETMAKTIYDYWFVQFDFPNDEGKPYKSSGGKMAWNKELKREIPEGWSVEFLKDIESDIVTGKTPSTQNKDFFGEDVPFITIGDIRGNMHITDTEIKLSKIGADTQSNKYIEKGSLCVSCIASPGLIGFATETSQTNQQINSIRIKKCNNKTYLYFTLKNFFEFSGGAKTGNTFSNMNKGDFESILIVEPPKDVLMLFEQVCSPIIDQVLMLSLQNKNLSALRDWLLPMLMNGQVRVG